MSKLTQHFRKGAGLPAVPALAQLCDSVWVVLGLNPGPYTLTGTNTYLVGTGKKRILIDTGEGRPEYIAQLEAALEQSGAVGLQEIVITHWHHDHLGGVPSVIKRFGAVPVRKLIPKVPESTFGGEGATDPYDTWPKDRFDPLTDGEVIETEGASLEVIHTPGHADDHVVLVHREAAALFSGDNVLGVGTSVFRDLSAYMNSLTRMRGLAQSHDLRTIFPAHGPAIGNAVVKIDEYIEHRNVRISQVEAALPGPGEAGLTCDDITCRIYTEQPQHLLPAAGRNTWLVLEKLRRDGRAVGAEAEGYESRLWHRAPSKM
mmetsp:Transcript_23981/g.71542  ORF Transcript_23981/g.71542 Transcript_23981/m.71542 type:complete len:317 (+) Transcript_23981:164-1114(+)